ncbi:MAG: LysR family transcriptional regulator [Pseudomonadota bacterium]
MIIEKMPNLRHLRSVLLAIRRGSISGAAHKLHLSQSAVSQGIAGLERLVGLPLLSRTPRGVFPTPEGELFARRIERAFRRLKPVESMLTEGGGPVLHRRVTAAQLRAVVAVTEHDSYSQAARDLKLSQPSVYRAVRDFEQACGQTMFRRSQAGVQCSAAARRAARCASLASVEIAYGLDELAEIGGSGGSRVRVGSLPLARAELIPTAVTGFLSQYPQARIQIVDGPYDELLHALVSGRSEVLVGALRTPHPSRYVIQEKLFEDALSIVVRPGHPLTRARSTPDLATLARLKWIVPRQNTPARHHFQRYFTDRDLAIPTDLIECSSLVATRSLLRKSERAALLSQRQIAADVQAGQLEMLVRNLPGTSRPIGLTVRADWEPTAVQRAFVEHLRGAALS